MYAETEAAESTRPTGSGDPPRARKAFVTLVPLKAGVGFGVCGLGVAGLRIN
jgi:hypothetical protein